MKNYYINSLKYKYLYLVLSIIFGSFLLFVSSLPYSTIQQSFYPDISQLFDMMSHFIGFVIFNFFLLSFFISKQKEFLHQKQLMLFIIISVVWGLICEGSQALVDSRSFQFIDIIANIIPPFIVLIVLKKVLKLSYV